MSAALDNPGRLQLVQTLFGQAQSGAEHRGGVLTECGPGPADGARSLAELWRDVLHTDLAERRMIDTDDRVARLVLRVGEPARRAVDATTRHAVGIQPLEQLGDGSGLGPRADQGVE